MSDENPKPQPKMAVKNLDGPLPASEAAPGDEGKS